MRYLSISDRNRTSRSSTCKDLHQPVSTFSWLFQALPSVEFLSLRSAVLPGKRGRLYVRSLPANSNRHVKFCAWQELAWRVKTRCNAQHVMPAMSLGSVRMCGDLRGTESDTPHRCLNKATMRRRLITRNAHSPCGNDKSPSFSRQALYTAPVISNRLDEWRRLSCRCYQRYYQSWR